MKNYFYYLGLTFLIILSCTSKKGLGASVEKQRLMKIDTLKSVSKVVSDTVRIANDSLQYEVIISDPGFSTWLVMNSYPRGYLGQSYLENKNRLYVSEWNNRVMQPQRYDPNLYEMTIAYDQNIKYGYEVNYLIYNYMIYFQNTFKQNLYGFVPPR